MKKLWILVPLLLLLTACAPQKSWCPAALEHFHLTETDVAGLEDMVQPLNETVAGEETSLRLLQSIGDGKTIYLFYELTLPEGWGAQLAAEEGSLSFGTACQFNDKPLRKDPFTSTYHPYNSSSLSWSEPKGDRITGHISYDFQEPYTGRALTVFLGGLSLSAPGDPDQPETGPPIQAHCGDLLSFSWTPTNQASSVTATAPPQGLACTVTPLRTEVELFLANREDPSIMDDAMFRSMIARAQLHYADGTQVQAGYALSGGNGAYTADIRPKRGSLFQPEQVETVELEGVCFRFAH